MRASPAFQITVRHFGVWRVAVGTVIAATLLASIAWLLATGASRAWPLRAAVLGAVAGLVTASARLLRCAPMSLRWDTQTWHLGPAATLGEEPWSGQLALAMDLGGWMLLKFEHDLTNGRRRVTWLPVQRRGLEAQWHALRCAVYSARPAEGHDGPGAAIRPESQE